MQGEMVPKNSAKFQFESPLPLRLRRRKAAVFRFRRRKAAVFRFRSLKAAVFRFRRRKAAVFRFRSLKAAVSNPFFSRIIEDRRTALAFGKRSHLNLVGFFLTSDVKIDLTSDVKF